MSDTKEIDARAADWIAERDTGRWSTERQQALDMWLSASTSHRVSYLRLRTAWQQADALRATEADASPVRRPQTRAWRIAAAIVVVAGAAILYSFGTGNESRTYRTAVGAREDVALTDGSKLVLNTDSQIRASMDRDRRLVSLDRGEVYFEVAHDAAHPFIVNAGDKRVTVLGTKFSVRRDGDRVGVSVVEGQVLVDVVDAEPAVRFSVLAPNDTIAAVPGHVTHGVRTPEQIVNDLSWRQGQVVFDQMTLAQAADEFNRYNTKKLVIATPAVEAVRIGGRFDVANVEAFARLLRQGFGLSVHETDGRIIISAGHTGS